MAKIVCQAIKTGTVSTSFTASLMRNVRLDLLRMLCSAKLMSRAAEAVRRCVSLGCLPPLL